MSETLQDYGMMMKAFETGEIGPLTQERFDNAQNDFRIMVGAEERGDIGPETQSRLDQAREAGFVPAIGQPFPQNRRIPKEDYATGVRDAATRIQMSRMDTREEKESYLTEKFGEGWQKNNRGQYLLKPEAMEQLGLEHEGMPVAIDEVFGSWYDFLDMAGIAPETLGAIGGGMAMSGAGVIPGVVAAGGGAMAGKLLDETVEYLEGRQRQSLGEVSRDALESGAWGVGGEGFTRGLRPLGRKILGPNTTRPFDPMARQQGEVRTTIDPRRVELTERALAMGAVPKLDQATGKPIMGRMQAMAHTIFGNPKDSANAKAILSERRTLMEMVGEKTLKGLSRNEIGDMIGSKIKSEIGRVSKYASEAAKQVDEAVSFRINEIKSSVGATSINIGETVRDTITRSKKEFSTHASSLYGVVDELVEGQKLVDGRVIQRAANDLLERFPKSKDGSRALLPPEIQKTLNSIINMDSKISFAEAQNIRTFLTDAAYNPDILKTIGNHEAKVLKKSVQQAIDTAFLGNSLKARRALTIADDFYKKNITKYDDVLIAKITRDLSSGGHIEPELVVNAIAGAKNSRQVDKIFAFLSDSQKKNVARSHFDSMLDGSINDVGEISSSSLHSKIRQMGGAFDAIYGGSAKEVRYLVKELAAKNGKIDLGGMKEGAIVNALRKATTAQSNLDTVMENTFIKGLKGGPDYSDAIDFIMRPDRKSVKYINAAKNFFGEGSDEWTKIKFDSMRKLLTPLVGEGDDGVKQILHGPELHDLVLKYRGGGGSDDALKAMFGKEQGEAIYQFSEVAKFLTSKNKLSGGLVAANIALHPLQNLGRMVQILVMGKMLGTPKGVNYFVHGFKAAKVRSLSDNAIRSLSQMMSMNVKDALNTMDAQTLGLPSEYPNPLRGNN